MGSAGVLSLAVLTLRQRRSRGRTLGDVRAYSNRSLTSMSGAGASWTAYRAVIDSSHVRAARRGSEAVPARSTGQVRAPPHRRRAGYPARGAADRRKPRVTSPGFCLCWARSRRSRAGRATTPAPRCAVGRSRLRPRQVPPWDPTCDCTGPHHDRVGSARSMSPLLRRRAGDVRREVVHQVLLTCGDAVVSVSELRR